MKIKIIIVTQRQTNTILQLNRIYSIYLKKMYFSYPVFNPSPTVLRQQNP
jgi:hypothetical protein